MSLTLNQIPGFADIPDVVLAAEKPVLGLHLARIDSNAVFGMVRAEVFTGSYIHNDTVPLPVSSVDGYAYSRDELMYFWAAQATANPKTGVASGQAPWTMWYGVWNVDQTTGKVESIIGYRGNNDHTDRQMQTNDGTLQVWTVAQRQRTTLIIATPPAFTALGNAEFYTDRALHTDLMVKINKNSKFAAVNFEVIYMGEFSHGATVPAPVSPADGYAYTRSTEVAYMLSWRWVADGTSSPVAPVISEGQLELYSGSVNPSTGVVTLDVHFSNTDTNDGKVAVFAFCHRSGPVSMPLSNEFSEIADVVFAPGDSLRASTLSQINKNCREAILSPEIFGPTDYSNGGTVPLPTSPVDGYVYSRAELQYVWFWSQCQTNTTLRLDEADAHINATTGAVTINTWTFFSGAGSDLQLHNGTIRVLVIAFRNSSQPNSIVPSPVSGGGGGADAGTFASAVPSTAISQPDATQIDTASVAVTWTDGLVTNYNSRVFAITDPGTAPQTYYVTVYDPTRIGDSGGTLTSFCDTDATRARTDGYVFLGKIIATHAAGGTGSVVGPTGIDQILVTVG